jgi:hypothetical protein
VSICAWSIGRWDRVDASLGLRDGGGGRADGVLASLRADIGGGQNDAGCNTTTGGDGGIWAGYSCGCND